MKWYDFTNSDSNKFVSNSLLLLFFFCFGNKHTKAIWNLETRTRITHMETQRVNRNKTRNNKAIKNKIYAAYVCVLFLETRPMI